MALEFKLEGMASLVLIQTPHESIYREEYFLRIKVDNGSLYGKERPLEYDVPLTKRQYEGLNAQINSRGFKETTRAKTREGVRLQQIGVKLTITAEALGGLTPGD